MFEPEYRIAFREIKNALNFRAALKIFLPVAFSSFEIKYKANKEFDEIEKLKAKHKKHFKLLPLLYKELQKQLGAQRAKEVMHEIIMKAGQSFLRGFKPLTPKSKNLRDFIPIYKNFEKNNIIFEVIEEADKKYEIKIKRCLIYESFKELGLSDLAPYICDVATSYFESYHPNIKYKKALMIARGDTHCHEVFIWLD